MKSSFRIPSALPFAAAVFAVCVLAASSVCAAGITVTDGFVRETPLKVSAGYMKISNGMPAAVTLKSVTAAWAGKIEMHDVKINDSGVLEMLPMGEIAIKPGDTVTLSPGGRHLMIYGLKEKLVAGEKRKLTLHFESAGKNFDEQADVIVRPVTYRGEKDDGKKNTAPASDGKTPDPHSDPDAGMEHMDHMRMGH